MIKGHGAGKKARTEHPLTHTEDNQLFVITLIISSSLSPAGSVVVWMAATAAMSHCPPPSCQAHCCWYFLRRPCDEEFNTITLTTTRQYDEISSSPSKFCYILNVITLYSLKFILQSCKVSCTLLIELSECHTTRYLEHFQKLLTPHGHWCYLTFYFITLRSRTKILSCQVLLLLLIK